MTERQDTAGIEGRLDAIRKEIAGLDRRLAEIVADRLRLAGEAARIKEQLGFPLRDPRVEEEVERRLVRYCETKSLEPGLVKELARIVIALSVAAQTGREPAGKEGSDDR